MRILVDENIPRTTVQALRERGDDVLDVRGSTKQGTADPSLWAIAQNDGRLLITTDKGFARQSNQAHHGLLIIRLRQPNRRRIHQRC